jgi:hypothetical protein
MEEWIDYKPDKDEIEYKPAKDFRAALETGFRLLPKKVVDFIESKYVLFYPQDIFVEGACIFLDKAKFKGKVGCILIFPGLLGAGKMTIYFVVAHEVAHAWLRKNKKADTEVEADKLAVKWLSKHYKESDLIRYCEHWKQGARKNTRKTKELKK